MLMIQMICIFHILGMEVEIVINIIKMELDLIQLVVLTWILVKVFGILLMSSSNILLLLQEDNSKNFGTLYRNAKSIGMGTRRD